MPLVTLTTDGLPTAGTPPTPATPAATSSDSLVAQGKARFKAYGCVDCHGQNGEGTDDAPDLIGTHLNAEQIAAFLNKPSADAAVKGMPDIPPTSPRSQAPGRLHPQPERLQDGVARKAESHSAIFPNAVIPMERLLSGAVGSMFSFSGRMQNEFPLVACNSPRYIDIFLSILVRTVNLEPILAPR